MLRVLTITVFVATLAVVGVLYKLKYDTRALQLQTVHLRKQIDMERSQVAVLKAEWSVLTQPERIDRFADDLGLKPLSPRQIISFHNLDAIPLTAPKSMASGEPVPFKTPQDERSPIYQRPVARIGFSPVQKRLDYLIETNEVSLDAK